MYMRKGQIHDVKCEACGKTYEQVTFEQVPGFRDREEDACPYCGNVRRTSWDVDFVNTKKED